MKNELNFEDLLFNEEQTESDYMELPLSRQTFWLVAAAVTIFGLIAFGRAAYLNVVRGPFYQQRALANVNREVEIPAPRGIIRDRFGVPMVENKNSFSAFLNVPDLLKNASDPQPVLKDIGEILSVSEDDIWAAAQKADFENKNYVTLARNITIPQTIALTGLNNSAIEITSDYTRSYPDSPGASHVLGYVGESDVAREIVGKSGLESVYNNILKGDSGRMFVYKDAKGNVLDRKVSEPAHPGLDIQTTVDAGLQKYFYDRLRQALAMLGRDSGAGLAIDPRNGEVLAMVSLPSYDNNNVAKYLSGKSQPLFNRIVSGVYTPGSTIKPLVALAALRENIVDPEFQILSTGSIEIPNPYDPEKPSKFVDWKAHGWVDLHSALARSSNVYFYEVAGGYQGLKGLGIERLRQYWEKFLLGRETGIDLSSESSGFLPAPEEKEERTGQIWRIGDTYNVSIGQGDLMITPLQLMNFIDSVANGGKIYRPHLVNKPGSAPEVLLDYSDWTSEIKEVQQGMIDAVEKPYGTANMLAYLPMSVAGKTGSSQVANNTRTNAFFVGYAPAEDPEIAVLVLIENSKEGSLNAVPVAKDVFEWYYYNRIANKAESAINN